MTKINEAKIEQEDVIEVPEIEETTDESGNDITDWKTIALERQELARKNQGIATRYKTKAEKAKETKEHKDITPANPSPSNEPKNDLGEKAYLIANGIKGADEIEFVQKLKKETGKDIDSLMETAYFQTELKDFREKKASANATPKSSKRSSNSSTDTVDYWLAKGELPPPSEVELRRQVVNARIQKEKKTTGQFYNS